MLIFLPLTGRFQVPSAPFTYCSHLTPQQGQSISKAMQMVGRYYVQYFNHTYERTGTLWEGRYKATLIDSERYLLTCYRYIELNPVRAEGMLVEHPSDYPWSSYRYNALGQDNEFVIPYQEYLKLGRKPEDRQKAYRALFKAHIPERTLIEIRKATNKAWVLGSCHFKEKVEQQLNRRVERLAKGGDRKSVEYRKQSGKRTG